MGEASNPGPVPALISIVNSNGDTTPLRLSDVGSRGHWRFQAQPYLTSSRRSSGDKLSPLAALTTWYQKHGKNLHPESQTHLEQLIREHSGNAVPLQTSTTGDAGALHLLKKRQANGLRTSASLSLLVKMLSVTCKAPPSQTPASLSSSPPCHLIRC